MNRKITQEKGITLIALVITIIIMLILAGVTINLVINGGLVGYAGNAKRDTQMQMELEELQMEVVTSVLKNNGTFNINDLNLGGYTVSGNGYPYTITNNETGNKYTIDTNGNIELYNGNEEGGGENNPPKEPAQYTITYHKNDGTETTNQVTADIGDETTLSTNVFTREWYRLEGWYANPECTGDKITTVTEDAEVYANWKVEKTIVFDNSYNGTYTVEGGTVSVNTASGMYPTSYPSSTGSNNYAQNIVYINTGTINLPDHFEFSADLYFNNTTKAQGGVIGVYLVNTSKNDQRYIGLRDETNSYLQMLPRFRFKSGSGNIFAPTGDTYNTYGTSFNGTMKITGNGTNMYGYLNNSQVTSMQLNGDFTFDQIWIQFAKYNNCDTIPMGVKQITIRELD